MGRGWRRFLEESQDRRTDRLPRVERIRKEKRSVRGRVEDDWLVDGIPQDFLNTGLLQSPMRLGRVMEVHKRGVFVAEETAFGQPDTGALWLCSVAMRHFQRAHRERNFVVVGDVVLFEPDSLEALDESGQPLSDLPRGVVQRAFARWSQISRQDPMRPDWEHVLIANIDVLVVVASVLNPEVRWGLVDRFLVQAELRKNQQHNPVAGASELQAVVVINKWDLINQPQVSAEFREQVERRIGILRQAGYQVFCLSALKPRSTAADLRAFKQLVAKKLIGFCGHSGVGKSSLLNLLGPEFDQIVDDEPEIFYKGRHTTTYNSLLQLARGGYAIDTPGIRSFHFRETDPRVLAPTFPEFRGLVCKYADCAHVQEEGCGVLAALREGTIAPERYRSYQGILLGTSFREGEADEDEASLKADLEARRLHGSQ